ncbi:hypothetical protein MCELHM10_03101 [Paracoccaceae bacterium]
MWPASWDGFCSNGADRAHRGPDMTNRIALWLIIILAGAILADFTLNDGQALFFLARRFLNLIEWVAFWR